MAEDSEKAEKISLILSAQIVHEIKNLPRGKTPPEAFLLLDIAYKQATGVEDLIKKAYQLIEASAA